MVDKLTLYAILVMQTFKSLGLSFFCRNVELYKTSKEKVLRFFLTHVLKQGPTQHRPMAHTAL